MKKLILLLTILTAGSFQARADMKVVTTPVSPQQVEAAENQLNQVYQQLRGTLDEANKKKLKASELQWIKQKETAIAASFNPDATHYQLVTQRIAIFQNIMNQAVQQQSMQQQNQPAVASRGAVNSLVKKEESVKFSKTRIEGVNDEKQPWVYEFLENKTSGKPSILDNPTGAVVFQNPDWIVKASQEAGNVGKVKTDIFFYNSRTLELVASVRIPNKIIKVGRVGKPNIFYAVTISPGKYRYDDSPLVICLIDPKANEIDRIKLVENDYNLALSNPIRFTSENSRIIVNYNANTSFGNPTDYITTKNQNAFFDDIQVSLIPGVEEYYSKYPPKEIYKKNYTERDAIVPSEQEFDQQSKNNEANLSLLGIKATGYIGANQEITDKASAAEVTGDKAKGIHLVRGTTDGSLQDIQLEALKAYSIKVASIPPEKPGIFSNGTLRCVVDKMPIFIKNSHKVNWELSQTSLYFDNQHAYSSPIPQSEIWWQQRVVSNPSTVPFISLDSTGSKEQIAVPRLGTNSEQIFAIYPELGTAFEHCQNDNMDNVFTRYSLRTGKQIGKNIVTSTGKSGTPASIKDGKAPDGWHVMSVITDSTTGGAGYSVIAQKDNDQTEYRFLPEMPELADPLEMRINDQGTIQILCSYAGITRYSEYPKETLGLNSKDWETFALAQRRGEKVASDTTIDEWKFSPLEGKPLLVSEKNLLFIPKPGGYDAYRIFGKGKPEKAFEIYFRGNSDYAIILPNGFYAGSPGCEKLFKIPAHGSMVDASSLAPWKNRPAEVIKALGGDPTTADLLSKVTDRWLKRIGFDPSTPEPAASEIAKVSVPQMPPLWAKDSTVSFPIEATAGNEPLKEITVRVNGVLQKSFSGSELNVPKGRHATLTASVNLAEGQNWIEVTATDAKGRPGNLEHFRTILPKASETPKRYIVAMGCSDYDRPELHLQFAAKDAGDVLKTFSEAGGRECKTLLLTNKDVGPEALDKIKAFLGDSKESDEVIFFCAGHGLLDEHLDYVYAGHQIDPEHPGQTGIKLDALLDAVSAGKSLKRLVLMDTCQSGSVGEQEEMKLAQNTTELPHGVRAIKTRGLKVVGTSSLAGADQQRFIEEMFLLPGQHRGINIIGASGGAEFAMESDKWNNGVFTSALIEALRDQKADIDHRGRISVSDLKTYLGQRVPELTGGAQKPSVVAFEQDQNFDLVGDMPPIPESVKNSSGATTPTEVTPPAAPSPVASESSSMAPPNLGSEFVNSLGQKFVPIPGTPAYFSVWDTRVSDYGQFVKETGRAWKPAGFPQKPDHPAVRINYNDATAFCEWLTQKEHSSGKLPQDCEYRLPMDLEWSAAAGIGQEAPGLPRDRDGAMPNCYAWGTNWPPPPGAGNFDPKLKTDKFPYTSPVGSFAPNKFGLYDISGNVFQWIKEDFDETCLGFLRGGSWPDEAEENLNLSGRCKESKENGYKCYGFRCVIAPIAQK